MDSNKNINLAKFENKESYTTLKPNLSLEIKNDFWANFNLFVKQIFKYIIKSKTFWILTVAMPMFMLIFDLIFLGFLQNGAELDSGGIRILKDVLNWVFIGPILTIGLIILPGFIVEQRESNLLKRMRMVGISKIQFYLFYLLFSFLFLSFMILIFFGPIYSFESFLASQMTRQTIEQYKVFSDVQVFVFVPNLILGILMTASLGYLLGMKGRNSRFVFYSGLGIYVFTSFSLGFNGLFTYELWEWFEAGNFRSNIGVLILLIGKYMYLFTPFTIFFTALLISANVDFYSNVESLYYLTISLSIIVSIIVLFMVTIKYDDIGNYETGR